MKEMKELLERMQAVLPQAQGLEGEPEKKWAAFSRRIRMLHEKGEEASFDYAGLQETARALAVQFEQAHPNLALLAGQLADMLGRMGV